MPSLGVRQRIERLPTCRTLTSARARKIGTSRAASATQHALAKRRRGCSSILVMPLSCCWTTRQAYSRRSTTSRLVNCGQTRWRSPKSRSKPRCQSSTLRLSLMVNQNKHRVFGTKKRGQTIAKGHRQFPCSLRSVQFFRCATPLTTRSSSARGYRSSARHKLRRALGGVSRSFDLVRGDRRR
jgi:hypothetical protein